MLECAGFPIICSKAACKDENGVKPDMILPACTQGKRVRRRLLVDDSSVEEMSVDDIEVEGAEEVEVDGADDVEVEGVDAVEVEGVDVMGLRRLDMKDVKVSMWVKVKYEEEVLLTLYPTNQLIARDVIMSALLRFTRAKAALSAVARRPAQLERIQQNAKAMKISNFPQQDVISEFLQTKDVCPRYKLRKSRPDMVKLMQFANEKLEWPQVYTREKVIDLVTLYDLQCSYQEELKLDHIVKRRVCEEWPTLLEVAWRMPDSWHLEEDDSELIATIEKLDLFKSVYPKMLAGFEAQEELKKGRKTGKKSTKEVEQKERSPDTNVDMITKQLMDMELQALEEGQENDKTSLQSSGEGESQTVENVRTTEPFPEFYENNFDSWHFEEDDLALISTNEKLELSKSVCPKMPSEREAQEELKEGRKKGKKYMEEVATTERLDDTNGDMPHLKDKSSRAPASESSLVWSDPTLININTPFQTPTAEPQTSIIYLDETESSLINDSFTDELPSISSAESFETPVVSNDCLGKPSYTEVTSMSKVLDKFKMADFNSPRTNFATPECHNKMEKSLDHSLFQGLNFSLKTSPWNCWTPSPVVQSESNSKRHVSGLKEETQRRPMPLDTERSNHLSLGGKRENSQTLQRAELEKYQMKDFSKKEQQMEFWQRTKPKISEIVDLCDSGCEQEEVDSQEEELYVSTGDHCHNCRFGDQPNGQMAKAQRSKTDDPQGHRNEEIQGCQRTELGRRVTYDLTGLHEDLTFTDNCSRNNLGPDEEAKSYRKLNSKHKSSNSEGFTLRHIGPSSGKEFHTGTLREYIRHDTAVRGMQAGMITGKLDDTAEEGPLLGRNDKRLGVHTNETNGVNRANSNVQDLNDEVEKLCISRDCVGKLTPDSNYQSRQSNVVGDKDMNMQQHIIKRNMLSLDDKENSPASLMDRLKKRNVKHRDILKSMEMD
ncbi:putative flap endonuclease GEN-like 1-like [Apostichopus japonicus]|uniref:Putative flap endonuclease GEN-like 1-like n=1 Tax=Stichopus japonicus TaxID=307972 RepID=A0A2G8KSC0_STIJA|nr:putative flap endonuclease GEN-like 1-like [Apostichopus japonicus]